MRAILRTSLLVIGFGLLYATVLHPLPSFAEQEWREEFEAVCSKTDAAMSLSKDELKDLVGRCDRLMEKIASEEETTRRIYVRRLKSCKDLFLYVLDTRKPE